MPKISRKRVIQAPVAEVWDLVSDPYHLPRWWPRTVRVENVNKMPGGKRTQWTSVLETKSGRGVRADYRVVSSAQNDRYVFEQELKGTPFERVLSSSVTEIEMDPQNGDTGVRITNRQKLRGLSRFGSFMMGRAQRQILAGALDRMEDILSGEAAT